MSNSADSLEENNDSSAKQSSKSAPQNNTESPIVTNAQVTDEQLINWIKSRRSIGNLSIPAPTESQIKGYRITTIFELVKTSTI